MPRHISYHITFVSICVALISVCAWITVPFAIPFTLQTFAICLIAAISPLKDSICAVLAYIAIGVCGLPIFSGFGAGPSVFIQPSGGYLIGFVFLVLIVGSCTNRFGRSLRVLIPSMSLGILFCYGFGMLFYLWFYSDLSVWGAFLLCVVPFLIPDILKVTLAILLAKRLHPLLKQTLL